MIALLAFACKTPADSNLGVDVPEPSTKEPTMRVSQRAARPERGPASQDPNLANAAENAPIISEEEIAEEIRQMGRTEHELRQMGITPDMTAEERAEAEARHAERRRPLPANPTLAQVVAKDDLAVLRTTPCEAGDCPVYQLRILNDRSLHYQGIENVELIGHYHGRISYVDPMSGLLRLATKHNYYRMDSSYPKEPSQRMKRNTATITEVDMLGRRNSVINYVDAPEGLEEIEEYLFDLLEKANWTELLEEGE